MDFDEDQLDEPPVSGISSKEIVDGELEPHFFYPNFIRPYPETEDDDDDGLDPIWLMPTIAPEPYWDVSMGQLTFGKFYKLVHLASRNVLT